MGAARDGGRPEVPGLAVAARLPVRALRGAGRARRDPRRRRRDAGRGRVGRGARVPTGPCVLEAIVDPEVPPLPPHITLEQAKKFTKAIAHGDPDARADDPAELRGRSSLEFLRADERAVDDRRRALDVAAYTIPTDEPESDGTLEWDSTTIVVVEAHAGGETGLGYTYCDARRRRADRRRSSPPSSAAATRSTCGAAWHAMSRALRNVGRPGLALDGALGGRHRALGSQGARCSACRSSTLLGAAHDDGAGLRQRRLHARTRSSGCASSSAAGSRRGSRA